MSNRKSNTEEQMPQLQEGRGLTDDKLKELRNLGNSSSEQEETDIM